MTLREIMLARFAMQAGTIVGVGSYTPPYTKADPVTGQSPDITPFWMLGGAGAEISVDTETGRIEVTKLVNVADVGRAINPASVERQLTGAAIMQLGFTLFEEMVFSDGQVVNASLADYKIPGFLGQGSAADPRAGAAGHSRGGGPPVGERVMGDEP